MIQWKVTLPDGRSVVVAACHKGEARGRAKRRLGMRRKDRLPVGTVTVPTVVKQG